MAAYNKNERRGILLISAVILLITAAMFFVRECRGRGKDPSPVVERILLSDSLRTAREDSAKNSHREKRKRGKGRTAARKSRRKAASADDFNPRDILADTISTVKNIE